MGGTKENWGVHLLGVTQYTASKTDPFANTDIPLQHHGLTHIVAAVADVYSVAFHNTAGRPFTTPASRVGKITPNDVAGYRAENFTGDNTVVVGLDIAHEELVASVAVRTILSPP